MITWRLIKTPLFFLACLVLIAVHVKARLHLLNTPLADWHSFRQSDTASVTREFVKRGIDVLHPRYHDVSNIQSGKLNLEGWRMVEFPLLNAVTAAILRANPSWDLVVTSRLLSIGFSTVSLVCLLYLARAWYGRAVSLVTGAVFALMPYNIFYSRVVLPEPYLVMFVLLSAVALWEWKKSVLARKKWRLSLGDAWLLLYGVFFALALLIKPTAIFFAAFSFGILWQGGVVPLTAWVMWSALSATAVLPLYWWRQWIQQFPTGIPASTWLLNGNGIRLKPAWWRWLFGDRLGRMMFGHWSAPFVLLGAAVTVPEWPRARSWFKAAFEWKRAWFEADGALIWGLFGVLAYLVVFASGNVQHDYYQAPIVFLLCLSWARGAVWMVRKARAGAPRWTVAIVVAFIAILSASFAWYDIRALFDVNNPAVAVAGAAVQRLTPPNALIIAPYGGDTTLLFASDRWGWPIGFSIGEKIADGAQYYVATAKDDEVNELRKKYQVIDETDLYILIDLTKNRDKKLQK